MHYCELQTIRREARSTRLNCAYEGCETKIYCVQLSNGGRTSAVSAPPETPGRLQTRSTPPLPPGREGLGVPLHAKRTYVRRVSLAHSIDQHDKYSATNLYQRAFRILTTSLCGRRARCFSRQPSLRRCRSPTRRSFALSKAFGRASSDRASAWRRPSRPVLPQDIPFCRTP